MPLPVQTLAAAPDSQQFGKQLIDEGGWGIDLVLETDMEFGHGKTCLSSQSLASVAQITYPAQNFGTILQTRNLLILIPMLTTGAVAFQSIFRMSLTHFGEIFFRLTRRLCCRAKGFIFFRDFIKNLAFGLCRFR